MTREIIQQRVSEIGSDNVESAKLLSVSVTTIRNALKFPYKLSDKMWEKLRIGLNSIGVTQ